MMSRQGRKGAEIDQDLILAIEADLLAGRRPEGWKNRKPLGTAQTVCAYSLWVDGDPQAGYTPGIDPTLTF